MNLPSSLFRPAEWVFRRLGYRLEKLPASRPRFSMAEALRRAADRGTPVRTVIDVGASDGAWSRVALRYFPEAQYLLFEPLEERKEPLARFCARHPNVQHCAAAAGAERGEISFHIASDLDGSGISKRGGAGHRAVPMTTIDHEIRTRELSGPYLLKLDTHGFELPILAGASETLRQTILVVVEVYNFQLNDSCKRFAEFCLHMEALGFRCSDLADPMSRDHDGRLWQMDLLFEPVSTKAFAHRQFC